MTADAPKTAASEKSEKSGVEPKGSNDGSGEDVRGTGSMRKASEANGEIGGFMLTPTASALDNPAADLRSMRRIIAEDPEWSLATVPLLADLCVSHIVKHFEDNSTILNNLLPKHKTKVLERISVKLPLKVTANLVDDEGYWQRCCKARWQICDVATYGNSWKRMYFEHNLQLIIENFVPASTDATQLMDTIPLSANFVKKMEIKQLLPPVKHAPKGMEEDMSDGEGSESGDGPDVDHFDFAPVLEKLPHIEELSVTYGIKDCGMNFEWNLFQFTARDCLLLAKCVAKCKNLRKFTLERSKVDDEKVRVLISHLLDHPGLVYLDLSHNIINDRGARAVGKFINNHSKLVELNLCDNHIRAQGAQAIAHALTKNTTLTKLDLRLNRLGDEGGQAICRSLLRNETLIDLNLTSNDLTESTAVILAQVVLENTTIRKVDLSCNRIGSDGGKQLQEGMAENHTITHMGLRLTDCGQESEYCINQILNRNREQLREANLNNQKKKTNH